MISDYTYRLLIAKKIKGIGSATINGLSLNKEFFQTPLRELATTFQEFKNFHENSAVYSNALRDVESDINTANSLGHNILSIKDKNYPNALRHLKDRPPILYATSNVHNISEKSLAVIGTRNPTKHGEITAQRIVQYYSKQGWQIVSGLALGIDTVAHKSTIDSGASITIAVLAHGLDSIHPKSNKPLAERILESGGVLLSEYSYGSPSYPSNFVERDRIQAGLSAAVIMVQSDETGGSWHASRSALRYGRYLIVPEPTKFDSNAGEAKVRGNRLIINSDSATRAKFLSCTINDLDRLIILRSREDYPRIEKTISGFPG